MLVLSRKVGEKIVIDNRIVITVARVSGGRVSVGIEAPSGVHVIRGELKPFEEQPPATDNTQARLSAELFDSQPSHESIAH